MIARNEEKELLQAKSMLRYLIESTALCVALGVLILTPARAQHSESGHLWPANLTMVEVSGTVVVTGTAPDLAYFIDDDGDGVSDYRMMLGPWWYEPETGASRPVHGETATVVGTPVDGHSLTPALMVFSISGEIWRTAVEYGMHGWNGGSFWVESGDTLTTSGTVLVDTTYFYPHYFLDEDADGVPEYRLGFGPAWYEPEGVKRPRNGQVVVVRGILRPEDGIDMLSVYELDGQTWRSPGDAAPWAGDWFYRDHADSLFAFCANDSAQWLGFPSGHTDGHHMGMGWPDSSFTQFWRIHPDSLPGHRDVSTLMGFYVDTHDPFGMTMMDGRFGGLDGRMQFSREFTMRLHYRDEDVVSLGATEDGLSLRSWDSAAEEWLPVTNATVDPQMNTITVRGSVLSKYYSVGVLRTAAATNHGADVPSDYVLLQNYPNPFNPVTTIRFSLATARHVRLALFDLVGREVMTLVDGLRPAGPQGVVLDAGDLPSGTYIYRLEGTDGVAVRKLTLLK